MANCVHTSINQEETRCDKNACAQDSYPVYTIQHLVVKRLYNRFDNRLYRVNKHPTGCQTGCQSGLTAVFNEQPLFVQPVVKPCCTTGLTIRYSRLSNGFDNRSDNRLHRVNGVLENTAPVTVNMCKERCFRLPWYRRS